MRTCSCPTTNSVPAAGSDESRHDRGAHKGRTQDEMVYTGVLDGFFGYCTVGIIPYSGVLEFAFLRVTVGG